MTDELPPHLNAHYLEGLRLFDAGEYHASHDAIEELWLDEVGEIKRALQALIQLAVALYHRENGNRIGALRLFRRAAGILEPLPPRLLELDLVDIRRRCLALADEYEAAPEGATYDATLVPDFTAYREAATAERQHRGLT